jgi:hypothetical protein
MEEEQDEE